MKLQETGTSDPKEQIMLELDFFKSALELMKQIEPQKFNNDRFRNFVRGLYMKAEKLQLKVEEILYPGEPDSEKPDTPAP